MNTDKTSLGSEWVAVSDRLPLVELNGDKVLVYRIVNDSQESLAISIYETKMVKYCDENETWWMELPKPPLQLEGWISVKQLPTESMKVKWLCEDGVEDIGFYYIEQNEFAGFDLRSKKSITHWKPL
jgi:hypothetical protein